MILRIIVTQMATRLDMLLEHWLLRREIGLGVKDVVTATPSLSLRTLGASTLDRKVTVGPKAALADYLFHSLEPPQITRVVIWKIERLPPPCQGVDAVAHAGPIQVVRPVALGILEGIDKIKKTFEEPKKRTFDHLGGRDSIRSTLHVAGCVVEQEEAEGKAICLALKDVDRSINLCDEFLGIEVSVAIFPRFEHDAGLPAE